MLVSPKIIEAINGQIGMEFAASLQYDAIGAHFDFHALPRLSKYFYQQSTEEREHAHRFMRFVLDAGAQVVIPAIAAPVADFKFAKDAVKLSLDQEVKVTQAINGIYDLALRENDHITSVFLLWFIKEQVEEVSSMSDLLKTVERAGEGGLLLVEQFLAQGRPGSSLGVGIYGQRGGNDVMESSAISLKRGVTATRIPQGEALILPPGTPVIITQALGGSFTVVVPTEAGLYRIAAEYADALGKEIPAAAAASSNDNPATEEQVWEALKTCYDPEIPVNIVDLGLVYQLDFDRAAEGIKVAVKMTLTAPGCGMGPTIAGEAQQKISQLSGVTGADVQVVWDPPWSPDKISEEGKKKLGMT